MSNQKKGSLKRGHDVDDEQPNKKAENPEVMDVELGSNNKAPGFGRHAADDGGAEATEDITTYTGAESENRDGHLQRVFIRHHKKYGIIQYGEPYYARLRIEPVSDEDFNRLAGEHKNITTKRPAEEEGEEEKWKYGRGSVWRIGTTALVYKESFGEEQYLQLDKNVLQSRAKEDTSRPKRRRVCFPSDTFIKVYWNFRVGEANTYISYETRSALKRLWSEKSHEEIDKRILDITKRKENLYLRWRKNKLDEREIREKTPHEQDYDPKKDHPSKGMNQGQGSDAASTKDQAQKSAANTDETSHVFEETVEDVVRKFKNWRNQSNEKQRELLLNAFRKCDPADCRVPDEAEITEQVIVKTADADKTESNKSISKWLSDVVKE